MDYALDTAEHRLVDWVDETAAKYGEQAGDWDPAADDELATPSLPADSRLHRLIVVEEAARAGLPALPGPRLLVAPDVLGYVPDRPVAIAPVHRRGPIRLPAAGGLLLSFDDADAWVSEIDASAVTPVSSSFGYPYAELAPASGTRLGPGRSGILRARWYLALAAEIAGTASAGLLHTSSYLDQREQFGRRLSSFQALRHRLAELAVSTEAVMWLARQAAWNGDVVSAGTALSYGRDLAAAMAPELVQLCGARGFTLEFPVHRFAMRLEGLRLETGAADRLAAAVWADLEDTLDG